SGCLNQHQANKQPSVVIQQIQNTVLNQLDKNWRLEDLGALYHYHPSYLSRLFKREEGISFSEYVMRMRIAEAQKRLMTTRHSIKSICLNVGYKDYHTFLSAFKDVVGMTPQAYRQAERLKDA
ncbi:MAG: helix-turn-helix transcriptional regulator, partial [Eubacteriales bacterium]|nr:helix-turn-helix transcriptional regulator [Eubacteriales bacterium]